MDRARILVEASGEFALSNRLRRESFRWFKKGNIDVALQEHEEAVNKLGDEEVFEKNFLMKTNSNKRTASKKFKWHPIIFML